MRTFTLRMQNIITTFILKALKVLIISITLYIYVFFLYIKLHKSKGLLYALNIPNIPKQVLQL